MSAQVPLPDPQEPSTGSSSTTDPMPVLNYATPEESMDIGVTVRVISGRFFGVNFLLIGGLLSVWSGVQVWDVLSMFFFEDRSWRKTSEDLFSISLCLLIGIVMIIAGYRWVRVRPRRTRG